MKTQARMKTRRGKFCKHFLGSKPVVEIEKIIYINCLRVYYNQILTFTQAWIADFPPIGIYVESTETWAKYWTLKWLAPN